MSSPLRNKILRYMTIDPLFIMNARLVTLRQDPDSMPLFNRGVPTPSVMRDFIESIRDPQQKISVMAMVIAFLVPLG